MSGASATPVPFPSGPLRHGVARRESRQRAITVAARDSAPLRLVAFAALAAFVSIHWAALLADPPVGRVAIATATVIVAATTIASIAAARIPRAAAWGLATMAALVGVAAAAAAVGLPARLLLPGSWGELGSDLHQGLSGLGNVDFPYTGGGWSRLAILLGLPLWLGLAAALAFWPARRGAGILRSLALVILVGAYATAVTVSPPGAPLVHGLALLLAIAAWLWLPALGRREALVGGALVLAAGVVALPLATMFDGDRPWLDYRDWSWSWSAIGGGESFAWDHSYGPLDWPRTGVTLLEIQSDAPHYWQTAVLDRFDGFRWIRSEESASGDTELPRKPSGSAFSPRTARLNPAWVHRIGFTIRGLRSDLVVGAGAALSVQGLDGVVPTTGGLSLPADRSLTDGDSYTVRAYLPNPSADRMRRSPIRYPQALERDTNIAIPRKLIARPLNPGTPTENDHPPPALAIRTVAVPFRGGPNQGDSAAAKALSASPYGGVFRLAHRLTDRAPTSYDAVKSIEDYLQRNFTYSETPPQRRYPLRAFLLADRAGYCQQFSGAMALMLRMVGIPTRVASGFSPGVPSNGQADSYVVRDFDAHSWVEVYFNGIGWVPFDPTPSVAPAQAQTSGLGLRSRNAPPAGKPFPSQRGGGLKPRGVRPAGSGWPGAPSAWLVSLIVLALSVAGGAVALGMRALRSRALSPVAASEARLRELEGALARIRSWTAGGTTLLALEHRLRIVAGPAAAGYVARLRAARYSPQDPGPPTSAERRAFRSDLAAGLGLRGRWRGLLAIPPGGPRRGD